MPTHGFAPTHLNKDIARRDAIFFTGALSKKQKRRINASISQGKGVPIDTNRLVHHGHDEVFGDATDDTTNDDSNDGDANGGGGGEDSDKGKVTRRPAAIWSSIQVVVAAELASCSAAMLPTSAAAPLRSASRSAVRASREVRPKPAVTRLWVG